MPDNKIKHMKFWGWGCPDKQFETSKRPYFDQFIYELFGPCLDEKIKPSEVFKSIQLKKNRIDSLNALKLHEKAIVTEEKTERVLHCYGKSYRDLFRARQGSFEQAPDLIVYPYTNSCIQNTLRFCLENNYQLIPFGGGTNIVGGVESLSSKPTICLDLKLMNKVITIDSNSHIACIQAGALGPQLEKQLNDKGWTLGHFPDSFEFSTLGGWLATRSAGMQSDQYGKIEDMVISVEMITPQGDLKTLTVPASSAGPSIKNIIVGSEGIFGVITSAVMKIHKLPENKIYQAYFFPNFESGINALKECAHNKVLPVINRLNDANKTKMSIAFKEKQASVKQKVLSESFKKYMFNIKGYDPEKVCMCLTAFEGSKQNISIQLKKTLNIFKHHGALSVGSSPGETFNQTKYDFPYVRDYVMNKGLMADVSETSTTWGNLLTLYKDMNEKMKKLELKLQTQIFLSCHISHSYLTGASLYFTWASPEGPKTQVINKYDQIKSLTEDIFLNHKATLSHHHATGYEHRKWFKSEVGELGIATLKGVKKALDPNNIMNNDKIFKYSSQQQ